MHLDTDLSTETKVSGELAQASKGDSARTAPNIYRDQRPVDDVVKDLSDRDKRTRERATVELSARGSGAAEALLAALETEGAKYRRQRRRRRKVVYTAVSVLLVVILVGVVIGMVTGRWDVFNHLGSFGGTFAAMGGAAAAMSPQHKSIVALVSQMDDVRSVGWLIDALATEDKPLRASAEEALVRLLPRLTAEDGLILDDERRRVLDKRLIRVDNPNLALAVLRAYKLVGNEKSLDAVVDVSERRGAGVWSEEVVEAAKDAATAIRARAEKQHQAQLLVRAVDAKMNEDTLLRAAEGAGSNDSAALLRPASLGDTAEQ